MKKKIILSSAFVLSLIPMLFNQYGGAKGVQEISGFINLWSPIGIIATILVLIGVWIPFRKAFANRSLTLIGLIGIVVSEIYQFLTWHSYTITGKISVQKSMAFVFPTFYVGLVLSLSMIGAYFIIDQWIKGN